MELELTMKSVIQKWNEWAAIGDGTVPPFKELLRLKSSNDIIKYLSMFMADLKEANDNSLSTKSQNRILSQIQTHICNYKDCSQSLRGEFRRELSIGVRGIKQEIEEDSPQIVVKKAAPSRNRAQKAAHVRNKTQKTTRSRNKAQKDPPPPPRITAEMERALWEKSIMDTASSTGLSNAMFFYNVKIFGLENVTNHRHLRPSHFEFSENAMGKYVQLNRYILPLKSSHEMKNLVGKIIQYEDVENPRSYYKLLQQYLHMISQCKSKYFYVRPNDQQSMGFGNQEFGIKALSNCINEMMQAAGYGRKYTTESLRSYSSIKRNATSSQSMLKEISKELDPPMPQPITSSPITQPITTIPLNQPIASSLTTPPIKTSSTTQPMTSPVTKMDMSDWDVNNNADAASPTMIQNCSLTINLQGSFSLTLADLLPPGTTVNPKGVQIVHHTEGQFMVKMDLEPSV
jgi:hypothetical protein